MSTPAGDLVEAHQFKGIRIVPGNTYPDADWYRVQCSPEQALAAVGWALLRVGEPYGWGDVAHDWNRPLFGLEFTKRTQLRAVDCSGLVCWSYAKAGVTLTRRPFPAPCDIAWSAIVDPI